MLLPDDSNPKACATSAVFCDVAVRHANKIVDALCEDSLCRASFSTTNATVE